MNGIRGLQKNRNVNVIFEMYFIENMKVYRMKCSYQGFQFLQEDISFQNGQYELDRYFGYIYF